MWVLDRLRTGANEKAGRRKPPSAPEYSGADGGFVRGQPGRMEKKTPGYPMGWSAEGGRFFRLTGFSCAEGGLPAVMTDFGRVV